MFEVCPKSLLPTVRQNHATGGVVLEFPDVCHCPVNGGAKFEVHELQDTCISGVERPEDQVKMVVEGVEPPPLTWFCTCPSGEAHLDNCPFDKCPIGSCHPMCSQATGDDQENYCSCPCHG